MVGVSMTNERSARRSNKKLPRNNDVPCDELGPDDGIDPRILFRNEHRRSPDDRKLQQLCSQSARAMQFALAGLCSDPILQELDVLHVEPAPDSRRLRVVVCPSSRDVHVDQVRQRSSPARWEPRAITRPVEDSRQRCDRLRTEPDAG